MAPQPFPLPISFGHTTAVKNSGGYLINMMAEVAEKDARTPVTLVGTPGTRLFGSIGLEPVIQMITVNAAPYAITERGFYRMFSDGGFFLLGSVALDPRASVDTNGLHIVVTDGKRAFAYTIQADEQQRYDNQSPYVNFVTELTGIPNFYEANTVTVLDQYFVFPRNDTNQFFNSQPLSITFGVAFTSAETNPDYNVAVIQNQQQLLVIGTGTFEFFYNSGVGDSPWQRVSGAVGDYGTLSPYTVAKIRNKTLWLDQTGMPVMASGYNVKPIGTQAIVDAFRNLTADEIRDASAFCYTEGTSDYWQVTAGNLTFCFDLTTGLFHQRSHYDYGRHIAACGCRAFGKNFVGSFVDGKVYEWSEDIFDDAGRPLVSTIVPAPIDTGMQMVSIPSIELEMDVGNGNVAVPLPKIGLEMSRDSGKTWGNQREGMLGATGEFKKRVRWQRNGSSRQPNVRFVISDAVPRRIVSRMLVDV